MAKNNPTISIIIPVYNTEKYLRHCLDSVMAQTYQDFECILVDDGSTDCSGRICDEYAAKDNRFQVIHKKNGGVATARQTGTDIASGNYIIHADPDDWVEPEMLKHMLKKAKENDADVTICDFYSTNISGKDTLIRQRPSSLKPHAVLEDIVLYHRLHGSLWNKLAKRTCYIKYGLSFTPGINYCEDVLIWVQLFQHQEVKVAYLDEAFYHYYQGNSDSITHSTTPKIIDTMWKYYGKLEDILPVEDQIIAKSEWLNFYFWLWRIGKISTGEFQRKDISNESIIHSSLRKKEKIACLLLNKGNGSLARLFLKVKKPCHKLKK